MTDITAIASDNTIEIPSGFEVSVIDSGKEISFDKDQRGVVVLHIWASWCSYCRREHKLWQHLTKKKGVLYVAATFREQPENSMKYLQAQPAPFDRYVYLDPTNAKKISARTIPDTLLICGNKILYRHTGSMQKKSFNQFLDTELELAIKQCEQMT